MSETLFGVLLGGLIGWIAPLMTLKYGERRWRFEAKVSHLKSEREQFAELYEKTIKTLADRDDPKVFSSNMLADILVLMPDEVLAKFNEYAEPGEFDEFEVRKRYLEFVAAMKRDLRARDSLISKLFES